jgi:hypothetical protein
MKKFQLPFHRGLVAVPHSRESRFYRNSWNDNFARASSLDELARKQTDYVALSDALSIYFLENVAND